VTDIAYSCCWKICERKQTEKRPPRMKIGENETLYNLCSSPNIIRVIKSRTMRWAGYVAVTKEI
jgi:hypothetical protein